MAGLSFVSLDQLWMSITVAGPKPRTSRSTTRLQGRIGVERAARPILDRGVLRVPALEDHLDERTEEPRVAHGDEVDGGAHQREPHRRAVQQRLTELVRVEAV